MGYWTKILCYWFGHDWQIAMGVHDKKTKEYVTTYQCDCCGKSKEERKPL